MASLRSPAGGNCFLWLYFSSLLFICTGHSLSGVKFHLLETQLDCKLLLERRESVLYLLCVLTGLRIIVQNTSDQVTYSVSRKFLLTPKT